MTPKAPNLDKALELLKRKKNFKNEVHNEIRDFFIDNLGLIKEGLAFVEKELRIVGGDIDIVAADGDTFYLIEIKTGLSKYSRGFKDAVRQLQTQVSGLKHITSTFTNSSPKLKLVIINYTRDTKKTRIQYLNDSGELEDTKNLDLD